MKVIYFCRVFGISYEFLIVLTSGAIYLCWGEEVMRRISLFSFNTEAVEWVLLYPLGITVWALKEAAGCVLFPIDVAKRVHEWPGYWKLRMHFDVAMLFIITSAVLCIFVWVTDSAENSIGVFIAVIAMLVSSVSAWSLFQAGLRIKEIMFALK